MKYNRVFWASISLGAVLLTLAFFVVYMTWTSAVAYSSMIEASQSIQVGMTFDEAHPFLDEAVLTYECRNAQLYFYGSTNPRRAKVLVLTMDENNENKIVSQITTPETNIVREFLEFGGCD